MVNLKSSHKTNYSQSLEVPIYNCSQRIKHRMNQALFHAKMEAIGKDKIGKFDQVWQPWIKHYLPRTLMKQCLCFGNLFLYSSCRLGTRLALGNSRLVFFCFYSISYLFSFLWILYRTSGLSFPPLPLGSMLLFYFAVHNGSPFSVLHQ